MISLCANRDGCYKRFVVWRRGLLTSLPVGRVECISRLRSVLAAGRPCRMIRDLSLVFLLLISDRRNLHRDSRRDTEQNVPCLSVFLVKTIGPTWLHCIWLIGPIDVILFHLKLMIFRTAMQIFWEMTHFALAVTHCYFNLVDSDSVLARIWIFPKKGVI